MKIKVFAMTFTAAIALLSGYDAGALSLNPFKSSSNSSATSTARESIVSRGLRYLHQRGTFACDSSTAGKIDGFRRCLASSLGSTVSMDKRSSVLALDSTGKPVSATINRTEYRQDWFRRWYLLNMESINLLRQLSTIEGEITTAEQAFEAAGGNLESLERALQQQEATLKTLWEDVANGSSAGSEPSSLPSTGNTKLDAMQDNIAALDSMKSNIMYQLSDSWESFYGLNEEIAKATGTSPQYTSSGNDNALLTAIPSPDALNPVFMITRNIPNSPLMSASFSASLDQFAKKNPNVIANFCNNFFNVSVATDGSGGGYEANYVRLGDTGSISPAMIQRYQTNKLANISMRCSQASMTGLLWRKLYSLCPMEYQGKGILACSDFTDAEVGTSQAQSS